MIHVYIGIGSNLNDPCHQIKTALHRLHQLQNVRVVKISSLYRSKPIGIEDQPDFVNAVVAIDTDLEPHDLLAHMQHIEQNQGRVRDVVRWGARVIDLDLLLYGGASIQTEQLSVPHPEMAKRDFVIYPLAEIAPDLILPGGTSIAALKAYCPARGIEQCAVLGVDFVVQGQEMVES